MNKKIIQLVLGILFGILLTKAEVISWFRIQEMFRFQAFHMYGIIGSAIVVGLIGLQIIKATKAKNIYGDTVNIPDKKWHWGAVFGGVSFGLGWALTGACPGPLFALFGSGYYVFIVPILFAILGTYLYGRLRNYLPH
ncbi:MAG: YeeE/YedE family protein [Bacteroidia bacterium]